MKGKVLMVRIVMDVLRFICEQTALVRVLGGWLEQYSQVKVMETTTRTRSWTELELETSAKTHR